MASGARKIVFSTLPRTGKMHQARLCKYARTRIAKPRQLQHRLGDHRDVFVIISPSTEWLGQSKGICVPRG
jgi:hypothetical protein